MKITLSYTYRLYPDSLDYKRVLGNYTLPVETLDEALEEVRKVKKISERNARDFTLIITDIDNLT